ncbi:hypothetical protein LXN10_05835 [Arcobacter sp. KX21116]|jgi:hypothetical protein|uniref:hypothetical protein n=1 Tax=Arcobacter iocasae TaxID=2906515 RepID=UPI0035D4CBED|tara:strand:+ start:1254 stop:1676 length:423 start_codon:yes stop_codon:yes gene_type:complete
MKIIFLILFLISTINAIMPKEIIGTWEMSKLDEKSDERTNISFGFYNSPDEPFMIEFKKNNIVKYEHHESYYIFDTNKIFVSKHKPVNGIFPNPKSIDVYEITGLVNRSKTNGKVCYEIHILQKAINGLYSKKSNQKICK